MNNIINISFEFVTSAKELGWTGAAINKNIVRISFFLVHVCAVHVEYSNAYISKIIKRATHTHKIYIKYINNKSSN